MSRPRPTGALGGTSVPRSALVTMAATRRTILRGAAFSGLAVGGAWLVLRPRSTWSLDRLLFGNKEMQ